METGFFVGERVRHGAQPAGLSEAGQTPSELARVSLSMPGHDGASRLAPPRAIWDDQRVNDERQQLLDLEDRMRRADGGASFFDTSSFDWVPDVEAAWPSIRSECDALLTALDLLPGFEQIQPEQAMLSDDGRWKIVPLQAYGHPVPQNQRRCPATDRALRSIPGLRAAMFSILMGGKVLAPHRGPYAGVLRYHLGVRIPQPERLCGIRVGGVTRHWTDGGSLIFDDSHLHCAWNHHAQPRVVLFVDFDRPLPAPLHDMNQAYLARAQQSAFICDAVARWHAWEAVNGQRLDSLMRR